MCKVFENATFFDILGSYSFNISQLLYSDMKINTINEALIKFRLLNGLSQLEFAKSINRGFSTITKWEQGLTIPKDISLLDIINIYSLPHDFFDIK